MLEIEKTFFKIKFSEINIRQRVYQKESIITVEMTTEFYPSLAKEQMVNGAIEVKLDLKDIHSLDDLEQKHYEGDIGNVTISVNNDGIWEHQSCSSFLVSFGKRIGREIEVLVKTDICKLETTSTIVSLYSTSTDEKRLEEMFSMKDFHKTCKKRTIGKTCVMRYYVKD